MYFFLNCCLGYRQHVYELNNFLQLYLGKPFGEFPPFNLDPDLGDWANLTLLPQVSVLMKGHFK